MRGCQLPSSGSEDVAPYQSDETHIIEIFESGMWGKMLLECNHNTKQGKAKRSDLLYKYNARTDLT